MSKRRKPFSGYIQYYGTPHSLFSTEKETKRPHKNIVCFFSSSPHCILSCLDTCSRWKFVLDCSWLGWASNISKTELSSPSSNTTLFCCERSELLICRLHQFGLGYIKNCARGLIRIRRSMYVPPEHRCRRNFFVLRPVVNHTHTTSHLSPLPSTLKLWPIGDGEVENGQFFHPLMSPRQAKRPIGRTVEMYLDGLSKITYFYLKNNLTESVSTTAPPDASDGFKTDSASFLPHFFFFAAPTCS